jgi:3-oxoacyl-[acyl-carrier protein] reductase
MAAASSGALQTLQHQEKYVMPDTVSLAGKSVLVTGASAGIGWATAIAMSAKGAHLVVTARREQRLRELCDRIAATGGKAVYLAGDAAEEETAESCVALAVKQFGRLDILINNAGAGNYKNLVDTSAAEYDALMDANMKSGFLFSRHAAPVMIAQQRGEILFISSVAGLQGYAGEAVYCASKFAQVGFAQALDAELRKYGIKVGAICPGGVKTEFAVGHGRTEESIKNSYMMEPHEVADAIIFACSQPRNARILQMTIRHMGEPPR